MLNTIRISSLLLSLLIMISAVSCISSAVPSGSEGKTEEITVETGTGDTESMKITDELGSYDFEGRMFHVVACSGFFFSPYDVENENGELLNDAAFRRNSIIEERFNMQIKYTMLEGSGPESNNAVIKDVTAGDQTYSLGISHPFIGLTGLITGGYVYNWNKVPAVDFDKPWWNGSFNHQLQIGNILPCASSDFIYFNSGAIFFNKDILGSHQLENPYESVRNGTWTWDKLSEMTRTVSLDINGDGTFDTRDQYGYSIILNHRMIPVPYSCGEKTCTLDADGYPTLANMNTEKMHVIVGKYYSLLYENPGTYLYTAGNELEMFRNGRVLFLHYVIQNIKALRELDFDYGLLPQPKYDKEQPAYYSLAQSNVMIIPSNASDLEFTGVIIEALSAESYKTVLPALYEVTFENKYLRDEDSYKMFNIIKDSLVYDTLWNYAEGDQMVYFLSQLMSKKSTDLSSFYAANYQKTENKMRDFYDLTTETYQ